jgi:hypothetical protein
MYITTQIKTIIFSLIFGIFFSMLININHKYLTRNKIMNIFITFIFIITSVLIYFVLLKKINNGIYNNYEIICIIIGFIIENLIHTKVEKIRKK